MTDDVRPLTEASPELDGELSADSGRAAPGKGRIAAWALWDWATQPFNSVIVTFVFTALYLTSDAFVDPEIAALGPDHPSYDLAIASLTSGLGLAGTLAGVLVALLAPVLGQQADTAGKRKRWLAISTGVLTIVTAALYFVQAAPAYFVLGVGLIAIGLVANELGGAQYNALITQVTTPRNVGRVSGLGWGLGYVGGIVALVLVVVADGADWWGMSTDNGMAYRMIALGCAAWTILFGWPVFAFVPEPRAAGREKVGFLAGYARLGRDVARLWRDSRETVWFLAASAIYRDGLAGVFAYGAVIASVAFGFSATEVLIFGIAANLVAGLATMIAGTIDDRIGPRTLILWSLGGMVVAGTAIIVLNGAGPIVFWAAGLVLCLFVGPVQAASRSLLARVAPPEREGEMFGLYATTGRAASWMAPLMWTLAIALTGATIWGVVGIIGVVAVGFVALMFVKIEAR
ncbi:MFS transporter [Demequina capsici]|uniref:MFS transporter n=1 Tax=Demequina capsici TaxID=3075620 RepID=A0AA96FHQ4_9MICO|nr:MULTISPECIES: MFS transporter [unclassified Demequina]WNM25904.1 MFS transporter [Demequina sp. OYTSA14]WNM28805.1 MFS transporter [Demequina sp. PMTSA13]